MLEVPSRPLLVLVLLTGLTSPVAAQTGRRASDSPHVAPPAAFQHNATRPSLRTALERHIKSADWRVEPSVRATRSSQQTSQRESFVKRHPVWTGALIGAAAGTAAAAAKWGSEGAYVGLYSGAAVGALIGWLASRGS